MHDPLLIAKLASKIQLPRNNEGRLLSYDDSHVAEVVGIRAPVMPNYSASNAEFAEYYKLRLDWTIKAEAALRVMLAKEILNAAAK